MHDYLETCKVILCSQASPQDIEDFDLNHAKPKQEVFNMITKDRIIEAFSSKRNATSATSSSLNNSISDLLFDDEEDPDREVFVANKMDG